MAKSFRPYNLNQPLLFAPDIRDWLPKKHISRFISELVEGMDLAVIYRSYKMGAGRPGFDPRLLLKILIYGYCKGIRSSRKMEAACQEDIAFRILAGDCQPDHDTIASFRVRHLEAFSKIFLDILEVCKKAGLLKMEHLSLDGTKIKANAGRCKSIKYTGALKSRTELKKEIKDILQEADDIDQLEDEKYGKGKRGDELPPELLDKQTRLETIERLIKEVQGEAKQKKKEYPKKKKAWKKEDDDWMEENQLLFERRPPANPSNKTTKELITSRRNPTDYDSRIMSSGTSNGYCQGYNCQAVADTESQVIVAIDAVNQSNDCGLVRPMLKKVKENTKKYPTFISADTGYYSERDIVWVEKEGIDPYIPPKEDDIGRRFIKTSTGWKTITQDMREKIESKTGSRIYTKRKSTIETVFGQIKENRNFRSFLLRGLKKVNAEWQLIAIAHNIGKAYVAAG